MKKKIRGTGWVEKLVCPHITFLNFEFLDLPRYLDCDFQCETTSEKMVINILKFLITKDYGKIFNFKEEKDKLERIKNFKYPS